VLLFLLNIIKNGAKQIDTSLDWADNNEKWDPEKTLPDDKVLSDGTSHPTIKSTSTWWYGLPGQSKNP
jgi:hypothetical protein